MPKVTEFGSEFCSVPYNSCNLGSINLANYVKSDNQFDVERFKQTIRHAIRFLDNMITVNDLPLKKINDTTKSLRSIGLGTMGLADLLYQLNLRYDSDSAMITINNIYKILQKTAINASIDLAEEKGVYPAWEGSVWQRKGIKVRNSDMISIAPNGSIAFIAGVSGGIEPHFALMYQRRTYEGDIYYHINPYFKQALLNAGIYSEQLLEKIQNNNGSCQGIAEIPQYIQDVFVTAMDIPPKKHVEIVGIIQQHVSLAVSKTVNLPNSATVEDIMDIYMLAWELGCKGITIYRDGSRSEQTLSTGASTKQQPSSELVEHINGELKRGIIIDASDDLIGKKHKVISGCGSLHVCPYFDPVTGNMLEVYLSKGSDGGCLSFMNGLSRIISLALRGGISLEDIVDQLKSVPSCPSYAVRKKTKGDTSRGNCCPAAIANVLLAKQIEMYAEINEDEDIDDENTSEVDTDFTKEEKCPECGAKMQHASGCVSCSECFWTRCG